MWFEREDYYLDTGEVYSNAAGQQCCHRRRDVGARCRQPNVVFGAKYTKAWGMSRQSVSTTACRLNLRPYIVAQFNIARAALARVTARMLTPELCVNTVKRSGEVLSALGLLISDFKFDGSVDLGKCSR